MHITDGQQHHENKKHLIALWLSLQLVRSAKLCSSVKIMLAQLKGWLELFCSTMRNIERLSIRRGRTGVDADL